MSEQESLSEEEQPQITKSSSRRPMIPLSDVVLISPQGPARLSPSEVTTVTVCHKADGLAWIPNGWVPPLFVISAECFGAEVSDDNLGDWINRCIEQAEMNGPAVLVRSSGTEESIEQRGRLLSKSCARSEILQTIRELILKIGGSIEGR